MLHALHPSPVARTGLHFLLELVTDMLRKNAALVRVEVHDNRTESFEIGHRWAVSASQELFAMAGKTLLIYWDRLVPEFGKPIASP